MKDKIEDNILEVKKDRCLQFKEFHRYMENTGYMSGWKFENEKIQASQKGMKKRVLQKSYK